MPQFRFEEITSPVLVLHGKNDGDVSLTHAESVVNRIPDCTYFPLDDTEHLLWLSPHYKKAKALLVSFVSQHPSTQQGHVSRMSADPFSFPSSSETWVDSVGTTGEEQSQPSPLANNVFQSQVSRASSRISSRVEDIFEL